MATPAQGDPFVEAAAEAVESAVMAKRLILAIADAVRRRLQREKDGQEQELPPVEEAKADAKAELKDLFPADISAALLSGADWPQMAQQMMALKSAGVDLEQFLPRVAEIVVTVRDQVAANVAQVAKEGTGQWERMLRESLPAGPVREAILSSPTWPDIAATMARLDERGVDVRQILAAAHDEGLGVDQAVSKVLAAGEAPVTSRDALLSWGPLTDGLDIPKDLDLDDRARALRQLAISPQENARYARMLKDALPDHGREADLAVTAKQWPLVAARMAKMESEKAPVAEHLAGLAKDLSWVQGPSPQLGSRLVQSANHVLRHTPGEAPPVARPRVSTAAARAQSTTVGPTRVPAAKAAAPASAGVAAHLQTGPVAGQGKTK